MRLNLSSDGTRSEARRDGLEAFLKRVALCFIHVSLRVALCRPARRRAHCRHVGEIHRERFVAEQLGISAGQKMSALEQHIGRDGELHAGAHAHKRGVVTDAERGARRPMREETADDFKLGKRFHIFM